MYLTFGGVQSANADAAEVGGAPNRAVRCGAMGGGPPPPPLPPPPLPPPPLPGPARRAVRVQLRLVLLPLRRSPRPRPPLPLLLSLAISTTTISSSAGADGHRGRARHHRRRQLLQQRMQLRRHLLVLEHALRHLRMNSSNYLRNPLCAQPHRGTLK